MPTSEKTEYTKRPLTLPVQVTRLKQRGLIFDNETEATAYLFNISYYRLRAYTYPYQDNGEGADHHWRTGFMQFPIFVIVAHIIAGYGTVVLW